MRERLTAAAPHAQSEAIQRAQSLMAESLQPSLVALETDSHHLKQIQDALSEWRGRMNRAKIRADEITTRRKEMDIVQEETSQRMRESRMAVSESDQSDRFQLECEETAAIRRRAIVCSQHYEQEEAGLSVFLERSPEQLQFLEQEERNTKASISADIEALRRNFAATLGAPFSDVLPDAYVQRLEDRISNLSPDKASPSTILSNIEVIVATLNREFPSLLTEEPRPRKRRDYKKDPGLEFSWHVSGDNSEILQIEQLSSDFPWSVQELSEYEHGKNAVAMVVKKKKKVLGYMYYELCDDMLYILRFAVHPLHRNQNVGSHMIDELFYKLQQQHRSMISIHVEGRNKIAQNFLRQHGFRTTAILRGQSAYPGEDLQYMECRVETEAQKNARETMSQDGKNSKKSRRC